MRTTVDLTCILIFFETYISTFGSIEESEIKDVAKFSVENRER